MEDNILEHFGVKGMKWGVRKNRNNVRVSTEAKRAEQVINKAKQHGRSSLTNKELADFNKRLELEVKFHNLQPAKKNKIKEGNKFVREVLAIGATVNAAIAFAKSPAGRKLAEALRKGAKVTVKNANKTNATTTKTQAAIFRGAIGPGVKALNP